MDTNCVVVSKNNSYHCCGCEETTDETVLSSISGSGTVVGDYNNNSTPTCHVLSDDEENSISSTRGKVVPCADDDPAAASRTAGGKTNDCCDGGGGMRLKMNHEQQQQRPTTIKSPEESFCSSGGADEETGLLMVVPKEEKYDATSDGRQHCHHHRRSASSPAGIVDFEIGGSVGSSHNNSDDETTTEVELNDSEKYLASGVLARALPERLCALVVTLAVEIPVLFMISGGSERLCMLIGRRRYQLMMAFLPLTSAISGNCGLQGSTLTTRAVSHMHVTKNSYVPWLMTEIAVSAVLGINMGVLLGLFAYVASGNDFAFGCTIFFAQFTSILTAGLTGTMAPLIFQFIFGRDSGKWGGPLETAVQDIVGSFAMVVLSYRILVVLGPTEIDPDDICGIK